MYKLTIDLVPASVWHTNVRTLLPSHTWDQIRHKAYTLAGHICEICGGVGPDHPVECHEVWNYNDTTSVQTLVGFLSLCPACHQAKHFGLARVQGKDQEAKKHLMRINGMTKNAVDEYIFEEFVVWRKRSRAEWKTDISYIREFLNEGD